MAKFLLDLQIPTKRTQLVGKGPGGKTAVFNCEYVTGTNLHFTIMQNKEKIIKMTPIMNQMKSLNGLEGIKDSCNFVMGLIHLGAMNRVIPNRMQYPNPDDPGAKKPKSVEILPLEHMVVTPHGFYIF